MQTTMPATAGSLRCQQCGAAFDPPAMGPRRVRWCSQRCRKVGNGQGRNWDRSTRSCDRCGLAYTPVRPEQHFCSGACRYSTFLESRRRAERSIVCKLCGASVVVPKSASRQEYCPGLCADAAAKARKQRVSQWCLADGCNRAAPYGRRECESHRMLRRAGSSCQTCGKLAHGTHCRECTTTVRRIGLSCAVPWAKCPTCGVDYVRRNKLRHCYPHYSKSGLPSLYEPKHERPLTCKRCGHTFIGKWRQVCTPCALERKRQHRKNRKGHGAWLVNLRLLADRDGHRCHLCRRKVRWDVPYRHPLYPSRDHLIPQSFGGGHEMVNLALAHRRCNSRRGNRGAAQLRLLA